MSTMAPPLRLHLYTDTSKPYHNSGRPSSQTLLAKRCPATRLCSRKFTYHMVRLDTSSKIQKRRPFIWCLGHTEKKFGKQNIRVLVSRLQRKSKVRPRIAATEALFLKFAAAGARLHDRKCHHDDQVMAYKSNAFVF